MYLVFLLHCMKSLKSVLKLAPAKKKGSFEGRPEPLHGIEYFQTISKEIKPLEEIVIGFAVALKEPHSVEDQIKILKAIITAFYDLKSKCVSLGPEYQDYFSKMWEHLHNSHCDDFCYIENSFHKISGRAIAPPLWFSIGTGPNILLTLTKHCQQKAMLCSYQQPQPDPHPP